MKLYAWIPKIHGPLSFYVTANSEEEAKAAVENKIKRSLTYDKNDEREFEDYDVKGWNENGYDLIIADPCEVLTNPND